MIENWFARYWYIELFLLQLTFEEYEWIESWMMFLEHDLCSINMNYDVRARLNDWIKCWIMLSKHDSSSFLMNIDHDSWAEFDEKLWSWITFLKHNSLKNVNHDSWTELNDELRCDDLIKIFEEYEHVNIISSCDDVWIIWEILRIECL